MIPYDEAEIAALSARSAVKRNFVWFTGRNRATNELEEVGFWNDVGLKTVEVVAGLSGELEERTYLGSGSLINVGDIPRTADISVRRVRIVLSPLSAEIEAAIRGYDPKGQPVEIHRGLLDLDTRELVAPPKALFIGFVTGAPISTPAEGGVAAAGLECISATFELLHGRHSVRSDAWLQSRAPGDRFYRYTGVAADWEIPWGNAGPEPPPVEKQGFFARLRARRQERLASRGGGLFG